MLVTLEGIDGVGKTTQCERLAAHLKATGREVVRCRDPGSTPLGEAVREIVLAGRVAPVGRRAEMLLYMAARAQLVEEVIVPALARGAWVLSDRFLLSNVVYQGHAGGLDPEALWQVGRTACDGLEPQLTFVLDMDPRAAMQRVQRALDRIEQRGSEFREKLRAGFLAEARLRPDYIQVVDAARPADEVQADLQVRLAAYCATLPSEPPRE